jgi:lipoprotein-anchoring transpeptidase ErfK/SrfK
MLPLLAILTVVLLNIPAYAGDSASWLTQPSSGITILHPQDRIDYAYDDHGHSATIYRSDLGLSWYSTMDAHTGKQTQGYLYEPMPRYTPTRPLFPPLYPPTDRR